MSSRGRSLAEVQEDARLLLREPFLGKRHGAEMVASRIVALVASVMALASARSAAAQAKPMVVIWQAPLGCPTAANVQAEVEGNLARSGAGPAPVVALVNVRGPTSGRWEASLLFQAGYTRAERRFDAESCEALAGAAAFIIALWAEGGPDAPPPYAATPTSGVEKDLQEDTFQTRAASPGTAPRVLSSC